VNEIGRHKLDLDLRFELCMHAYWERVFERMGSLTFGAFPSRDFPIRIGFRFVAPREKTLRQVGAKLATGR
jgi:hypothetical protein